MLKLYGSKFSPPVNKTRIGLNALGLKYQFIPLDMTKGEHRQPSFRALSPIGKVPLIDDDGFTLGESDAILKYLCRKHASPLYPEGLREQAIVDQWCGFVSVHVQMAMARILFNRIVAPMVGAKIDENSLATGKELMLRFNAILDSRLEKSPYLAGDTMTIVDISLVATIDPAEVLEMDLSTWKHLVAWRKAMQQQPFYRARYQSYADVFTED